LQRSLPNQASPRLPVRQQWVKAAGKRVDPRRNANQRAEQSPDDAAAFWHAVMHASRRHSHIALNRQVNCVQVLPTQSTRLQHSALAMCDVLLLQFSRLLPEHDVFGCNGDGLAGAPTKCPIPAAHGAIQQRSRHAGTRIGANKTSGNAPACRLQPLSASSGRNSSWTNCAQSMTR
jgi:hypothetical protein